MILKSDKEIIKTALETEFDKALQIVLAKNLQLSGIGSAGYFRLLNDICELMKLHTRCMVKDCSVGGKNSFNDVFDLIEKKGV